MKRISLKFSTLFLIALLGALNSCVEPELNIYRGDSLVHFPQPTSSYFVVQSNDPGFGVRVGVTAAPTQDLQIPIEIDEDNSTAISGVHYNLNSMSVTIPAGQTEGTLQVSGIFQNLGTPVVLAFTLPTLESGENAAFRQSFSLTINQFCPYVQSDFVGTFNATSTFRAFERQVEVIAGSNANEVIVKDLYAVGLDVKISLNDSNMSNFIASSGSTPQHAWNDSRYAPPNVTIQPFVPTAPGVFSACNKTIRLQLRHCVPAAGGCFGPNDTLILTKI